MIQSVSRLDEQLRDRRIASLRSAAETIRNWPNVEERDAAQRKMVSELMLEHALGRMTLEHRSELFAALDVQLPHYPDVTLTPREEYSHGADALLEQSLEDRSEADSTGDRPVCD